MKLATFVTEAAPTAQRVGLVIDGGIIDIGLHHADAPRTMIELLATLPDWDLRLRDLETRPADHLRPAITLLAPVPRPGKIWGMGLNYADHIRETGKDAPTVQTWFSKPVTAVNAPYGHIDLPLVSKKLDYEAELAFVIGRRCRHVPAERAAEVIAGYCVANDVSVRDWQTATSQHGIGKSFDTHAPFGPWITTADEVGDAHALDIRCFVNDDLRQHSNTRELVFSCYEQVAHLSKAMTLEPGDVFLTGTPSGVGSLMKPPCFLQEGDRVRVEITRLGAIEHEVRAETASA